jgi:tetratricopeptide (TPR) repeat protein
MTGSRALEPGSNLAAAGSRRAWWYTLTATLLVLAVPPAWAQSTRYPPQPTDPDREAERHSKVWEDALDPERTPYQQLVRDARLMTENRAQPDVPGAIEKLDQATTLLPRRPEAYALRGGLELARKQWQACAQDLAAAEDRSPPDETGERTARRVQLGICQARAGRPTDAETTLARAASAHNAMGDAWMRLGEVRIVLGKLDEAIGALHTATELGDPPTSTLAHFLLAVAFDRARLPGEAEAQVHEALRFDPTFNKIDSPTYPLLGPGEREYMLGLAHRYGQQRPEYALLYFRRFVALAPDSPWRRRAEEHVKELSATELPQTLERRSGTAALDIDAARVALARVMPQLRACAAKLPTTALEVVVTKDGPRSPEARDLPHYRMPVPGVGVHDLNNLVDSPPRAAVDEAQRCIEPIVERTALPTPKEHDTWYVIAFLVVSP